MNIFKSLFINKNYTKINHQELNNLLKKSKDVLILDVRTSREYSTGHIPKSENISLQDLKIKLITLERYKDKDIVVYCASGARSISAAKLLSKNGFTKVFNLGGINNYKGKIR